MLMLVVCFLVHAVHQFKRTKKILYQCIFMLVSVLRNYYHARMETMSLPSVSEIGWHAEVEEEEDLETEAESDDFIVVGTKAISALKNALGDKSSAKSSLKLEELIYELCDRYSNVLTEHKKCEGRTRRLSSYLVLASMISFYYSKQCKKLIANVLKKPREKTVKTNSSKQRVPMYHPQNAHSQKQKGKSL